MPHGARGVGVAWRALPCEHHTCTRPAQRACAPACALACCTAQVQAPRDRLHGTAASLLAYEQYLHLTALACAAAAVVASGQLPPKLNQIIQPLMAAVRKEPEPEVQVRVARARGQRVDHHHHHHYHHYCHHIITIIIMTIIVMINTIGQYHQPMAHAGRVRGLAQLMAACAPRTPSPNDKLLKNITIFINTFAP